VKSKEERMSEFRIITYKIKYALIMVLGIILFGSCTQISKPDQGVSSSGHLTAIIQSGELRVGTLGNMPPLNMTTKNGEVIGYEIDMARMMADELDVELKVKTMPFYELLPALEMDAVDMVISGMTITSVRKLRVAFAGPYYMSGKSILTKSKTIASVSNAAELNRASLRVAALRDSTSQEFVESVMPDVKLTTTANYDEAIQLLLDNRVHALVADYPICIVVPFRYPDSDFVSVQKPLTFEPYGIALPLGDAHFINWVDNFLGILKSSGKLEDLEDKWFGNADWFYRVW
jgi:polar amino acid transport system substrate-binding protein